MFAEWSCPREEPKCLIFSGGERSERKLEKEIDRHEKRTHEVLHEWSTSDATIIESGKHYRKFRDASDKKDEAKRRLRDLRD